MQRMLFLTIHLFAMLSLVAQRDPLQWPFADSSIWNMPIGSGAVYVPAGIEQRTAYGMTVDEDLIVMRPEAPMLGIYTNHAGWSQADRCPIEGPLLLNAPIPDSFIVSPDTWDGNTPNSGLAVLMPDGRTIQQTQPFSRCDATHATSLFVVDPVDLYGTGISGAHGGSGLSAIGGALRLGELDEATDTIRHALKVNLFAARNLFYDTQTAGYRWPALRADSYAAGVYGTQRISPAVEECRMGALLALPDWMDLDSIGFETVPARILAQAFQAYGAYIVDDTYWDVYAIITEWSPEGRVTDEFEAAWGFPISEANTDTPWARDMDRIFLNLHVVDNNAPGNIGGGGTPLVPLAPPFETATSIEPITKTPHIRLAQEGRTIHLRSDSPIIKLEWVDLQGRVREHITFDLQQEGTLALPASGLLLLRVYTLAGNWAGKVWAR